MTDVNASAFIKDRIKNQGDENGYTNGLTKREYLAAMAMQGICANSNHIGGYLGAAKEAVKQADALINELNTKTSQ